MDAEHALARHLDTSWAAEGIVVLVSPLGGRGTFARTPIVAGEPVFHWGGTVYTAAEVRAGEAKPGTVAAIEEGVYLATPAGGPDHAADFTNHSCDPNLWMLDAVTLIARRDIAAGDEVTGDYAMWEADEAYVAGWRCRCGLSDCRGHVTGRDWRLGTLQERYRGHFSPFINRRIAALARGESASETPPAANAGSPPERLQSTRRSTPE